MNVDNAKIYVINPEQEALRQFEECCSCDFVVGAALMPDAHTGYVAPIGSVLITKDVVVPSWVGYDIGCGMIALKLEKKGIIKGIKKNSQVIFDKVREIVPMGMGRVNHIQDVSFETKIQFKHLLEELKTKPHNKGVFKFIKNKALSHLGSLGDGNHFIELLFEENKEDTLWLVIHSGSRGVGHKLAQVYMKKAANEEVNFEQTFSLDVNSLEGEEYLALLDFGLDFALLNRLEMAKKVEKVLKEVLEDQNLQFELWTNKNHNHAIKNKEGLFVHRKGATPASRGERGVIPANMRDGCFLVEGLGSKEFLESSSHGAGRLLSRTQARNKGSMKEFRDSMQGIVGTIEEGTLDEAPFVYKNISEVMNAQKKSVKILKHLKPLINWKGSRRN